MSTSAPVETIKNGVKQLIDAGGERASDLKDSAIVGAEKLGKLIKAHPIAAVMIGFGAGYLVMRMMRR